jgi:toxin ParE1/3/4
VYLLISKRDTKLGWQKKSSRWDTALTSIALRNRNSKIYIADQSGASRAWNFISGIRDHCQELAIFPERGSLREELRPGLRIIGYRRRVSIAFSVSEGAVHILGVFYGGRQISAEIIDQRG